MNIQEHIRKVLREENEGHKVKLVIQMIHSLYDEVSFIEQSTYNNKPLLKIYFNSDDTAANIESWFDEKISRDIDEYTSGNIVACPSWMFDWDWRKKNADVFIETELLKYDNLGNVVNESVLREETSSQDRMKNTVSEIGFINAKKMIGGIDNLYKVLGFTGTQEEMIFIVDALMKHDVPILENICNFRIVLTKHSLKLYVEIPKYYSNLADDSWANRQRVLRARDNISTIIHKLGNNLVKGHTIDVSLGKC